MILRKEETVGGPSAKDAGSSLAKSDCFTGALGEDGSFGVSDLESVAKVRGCAPRNRLAAKATGTLRAPDVNGAGRAQLRPA